MPAAGLNRIHLTVPGSSTTPVADRDGLITQVKTAYPGTWSFYHYSDLASGMSAWSYTAVGLSISTQGVATVCTVVMSGMGFPPWGSDVTPMNDPGAGTTFVWTQLGAPFSLSATSPGGGGSAPAGNNNYYVWRVSSNSPTAPADFTTAINAVIAAMPASASAKYLKYVDSVSGAWQVWFICFQAGEAAFAPAAPLVLPNNNILYVVTCSGTPHPPTGSTQPVTTYPAFTQTFTTLGAPLNFGPMR